MRNYIIVAIILLMLLLTGACKGAAPEEQNSQLTPVPSVTPVPAVAPATAVQTPLVMLVLPADLNPEISKNYQKAVYDLSQAQGFRFVVMNSITEQDLEPALKIVIDLSADTEIGNIAAKAPQTQFLAVNIPGVNPGGNMSILGGEKLGIDKVAFMSGYIGAQVTEDYRTGALVRKGSPDEDTIITAMRTGQHYFCGLCNPFAGPFERYPLLQDIPQDAKPSEYGAYADILIHKQVTTIFIEPGIDIPELLQYLQSAGILMIGTQSPAKPVNGWIVTLEPNYLEAMKAAFPELAAGNGGKSFPAPLNFDNANSTLFSQGKQDNARKTLDLLVTGFINPIEK
ncbi:MAG: hypothetical protein WCP19_05165 [Chloroflexota bacterium]